MKSLPLLCLVLSVSFTALGKALPAKAMVAAKPAVAAGSPVRRMPPLPKFPTSPIKPGEEPIGYSNGEPVYCSQIHCQNLTELEGDQCPLPTAETDVVTETEVSVQVVESTPVGLIAE